MKPRHAFTLVEVLIVVVIMAVLAAAIIPQFSDASNDAKLSTSEFNWHTLKSQVEMYRSQHNGLLPDTLSRLTDKTDRGGKKSGEGGAVGPYIYGPYISQVPVNPWNNSATEVAQTSAPSAYSATDGWYYDSATGNLWLAGKENGSFKLIGDN